MSDKMLLYFKLCDKDYPYLEKVNPFYENGKKYYTLILENNDFNFGKVGTGDFGGCAAYLFIDDSSDLASNFKKMVSEGSQEGRIFSTPFSNLKFKAKPFTSHIALSGNGFFVKNTDEVKELSEPKFTSLNFKVIESIKSGLDKTTLNPNYQSPKEGDPYAYVLKIEPLNLGVEGMSPITQICFFCYDKHAVTGKISMSNFKEKYEKIVAEATKKEFTMEIKKWMFADNDGCYALNFQKDEEFGEITEIRKNDKPNENNDQAISQIQNETGQTIDKLLTDNNLKVADLDSKFANWEVDLSELDSEGKIKDFQQQICQEIQAQKDKQNQSENKDKGLSLPVKLLIGGGAAVVILGLVGMAWYLAKK